MTTEYNELLDNEFIDKPQFSKNARRKLLPWWYRFFTWVFMILGTLAPLGFIAGLFNINFEISLYGFTSYYPLSAVGFAITLLMLFKGITAYSIWFQTNWAINLAILDGLIGILACILSFFIGSAINEMGTGFNFRLDIIFIIPYLIKSIKIHERWKELEQ